MGHIDFGDYILFRNDSQSEIHYPDLIIKPGDVVKITKRHGKLNPLGAEIIDESGVMDHTFEREEEAFYETIIEAFRWADGQLPGNNYGAAINGLYQRYVGDE